MVAVSRLMVTLDRLAGDGDLDGLAGQLTDDAVLMPPGRPAIVGKRAIGGWLAASLAEYEIEISHESLEIDAAGRFLVHRGIARGTLSPKDGAPSLEFEDKYLYLIRRLPGDSLLIWRAIFNSNGPAGG